MSSNRNQVISCGACAVMVEESGQMVTSIDVLANGVKRLFSGRAHGKSQRRSARAQA